MTLGQKSDRKLDRGCKVINQLEKNQFEILMDNVCHKFLTSNTLYSDKEKTELKALMNIDPSKFKDPEDFDNLLYAIIIIISRISFANISDENKIKKVLEDSLSFGSDYSTIFCEYWSIEGQKIIDTLKNKSIWPKFIDVKHSLDIRSCSSIRKKEASCNVKLELQLEDNETKKLTVQLNKKSLTNMYQSLEKIQAQLDELLN